MMRNLLLPTLLCLSFAAQAQYAESFSVANKGYKMNCVNDFIGVNWFLTPWDPSGSCRISPPDPVTDIRDPADYFTTTALGVLESIDMDEEVCWESPLLNTAAANPVSLEMLLTWVGFDTDGMSGGCLGDYIKVLYSVNGGVYTMIPNVVGGNACATIAYPFGAPNPPFNDNLFIVQAGIAGGSTLKIKVCVFTNANAEMVAIDNVTVPETGVFVIGGGVGVTDFFSESGIQIFPNPASESVQITLAEAASGIVRVLSVTGQVMTEMPITTEHLQFEVANWPSGMYFVEHRDAGRAWAVERFLVR